MKNKPEDAGASRRRHGVGKATLAACLWAALVGAIVGGAQARESGVVKRLIIGGSEVPKGEYPFVVSLHLDGLGADPVASHRCGGSLLTPTRILTAAHCVAGETGLDIEPANVRIVINRADLGSSGGHVRRIRYSEFQGKYLVHVHPEYLKVRGNFANDVAIIELDEPVHGIEPVHLPTPGSDVLERPGQLAIAAGWGNTSPYSGVGVPPSQLMGVRLPVVSQLECTLAYGNLLNTDIMLCAGRSGFDSCQGDSGGPLFMRMPGVDAVVQTGIVSWGEGCGQIGYPGVYTRLSDPGIHAFIRKFGYDLDD